MDISKLTPETAHLWMRLEGDRHLQGFVLIGGTALSLRIGHRLSDDLDFLYLGRVLPIDRLAVLLKKLRDEGMVIERITNVMAEQDFLNDGLNLAEHQQDYVVNGATKLSFVRLENVIVEIMQGDEHSPLRIATVEEIFHTKALVCADRNKSRDWFDLYMLLTRYGYCAMDMYQAYVTTGQQRKFDMAGNRLRACKPGLTDEGYSHLLAEPPTLEQMREFFVRELDQLEVDLSRQAFKARL